jgi:hemolysin activation/secretion protein
MDMGGVWNVSSNPNSLIENQTFIIGLGLGVLWQPVDKMQIRLDYAPPIITLDTKENNVQDNGFYFSINYGF